MNPRLFCRERTFHKALVLTYSFDPIFFEQVVLPDLWSGRTGDILAIGDRDQIVAATEACAGQLWHLGKSYLLAAAKHDGAFHPKLILRLGPKDGAVLIGSGNVTSSGWGGNQELGTRWMLGPGHADDGSWLQVFLADVMNWCGSDLERDAVARMRDAPWLSLTPASAQTSPVLHSRRDITLASLLAQRWTGRRFDSVRILTGSTDQSGAFLRWAHATFGIKRAVVACTPAMASFDPTLLGDLPIELTMVEAPPERPMHAKFFWFDGESGAAAVMGSANCSAAAWLVPPSHGGNIETIIVYDSASAEAYEDVLTFFERPAKTPAEFLSTRTAEPPEPNLNAHRYRLLGLQWDNDTGQMSAVIDPRPEVGMTVDLMFGPQTLAMSHQVRAPGHWVCTVPEGLGANPGFAFARVVDGLESWTTAPRWIDDLVALRHASQSARLLEPFKGLERSATSSEQRQVLEELHDVAHELFHDTASFRDPGTVGTRETNVDSMQAASPVNPNDLLCHLHEGPDAMLRQGDARPGTLSITGIMRLLFDSDGDATGTNAAADDEDLDEGMAPPDSSTGDSNKRKVLDLPTPENPVVEARFRERLASQITTFLAGLRSSVFAECCSATQMVQAVAFPLAVALRGQKRGWVSRELAERWGLEVISILFRGSELNAEGLLHAVERRYAVNGQGDIFGDIVGDGTLWVVLVATLGGTRWREPGTYIDKAVGLREVYGSQALLASARPERVAGLLGKVLLEDARRYVANVAPTVTRLLDELEALLRPVSVHEAKTQTERRITHMAGDLLWRENVGWAVCLEENALANNLATRVRLKGQEKRVMAGYYVNVSDLTKRHFELHHYLTELYTQVERKD